MELLGDRNWWLPGWLDRLLPHIDADGRGAGGVPAGAPEQALTPVPVPEGSGAVS
jgi:putative drug exporter of the RND superfamily